MNIVEMSSVTKTFGSVIANNNVSFQLEDGEIHGLLGENGAGKTTLMRILYGLYQADQGEIIVNNHKVNISSPNDAIHNGIGMVTQHFTLVPTLTVTENILLSKEKAVFLDFKKSKEEILTVANNYGIPIQPDAYVKHLSIGERQRVEIFKALYRKAKILIMDEPTAVLIPQEIDQLMSTLRQLNNLGLSIIFISHKLNEVMSICNRVSVLRNGKFIGTVQTSDVTQKDLARMMVGRETFGVTREEQHLDETTPVLKVVNLWANNKKGHLALKDISFEINKGELLGIAGVSGNGQSELAQVLSGVLKSKSGEILFKGQDITKYSPNEIVKAGIGRVPEDRNSSIVGEMTLAENMVMEHIDEYTKNGMLQKERISQYTNELISDFSIKAKPEDPIRTLSGGNMQKAVLARVLSRHPELIIVSQPTRGLDVGATEYIRSKLIEQANIGAAVLLFSEDLDEIFTLTDRIAVIYEGKIMDIVPTHKATFEQVGLLMAGAK